MPISILLEEDYWPQSQQHWQHRRDVELNDT
ncbi:uncharacterized protein METZ01_LOCUS156005, partial [marine metagenome]